MKISLIIPAYNEEKYIGSCLEYAIQNGKGYFTEIIVIDNASTDATKKIAESYPGVRVITEQKKGPTFARQRGYIESKGEILAFIDADTRMPVGRAKKIKQQFVRDNTLGILTGPYSYYDLPWYSRFYSWLYYNPLLVSLVSHVFGGICTGGNFAIKKTILDQMGGFNINILFYGDEADITKRAKKYGKIKYTLSLDMPTSSRRYAHQGVLKTGYLYIINYISMVFCHKPSTTDYEDFR